MSINVEEFGRGPDVCSAGKHGENATVLVAATEPQMRRRCKDILSRSGYTLLEACRYSEVAALLCRTRPAVVIAESRLGDGTWKDILGLIAPLPDCPALIVIDRLADELLWAEVLCEGAFDLLAEPLDSDELERTLAAALRERTWTGPKAAARAAAVGASL